MTGSVVADDLKDPFVVASHGTVDTYSRARVTSTKFLRRNAEWLWRCGCEQAFHQLVRAPRLLGVALRPVQP